MVESIIITLLPVVWLIVLFGGGARLRRRNIDMDGVPPINKRWFYLSKYAIPVMWAAMALQSWGVNLSFFHGAMPFKPAAIILLVAGFVLLFIGRFGLGSSFRMGSPRESTSLKVDGLYQFSRNPMYLGVYATLLATVLYTWNPIVLLVGIFIVAVHHKIVLAEEQHLRATFGEAYVDYCGRVRRYL